MRWPENYTIDQIKTALHADEVHMSFKYLLLDKFNRLKKTLTNVTFGHVENNALAQIKRTGRFTVHDDGSIDFLSDRIQPWCLVKMSNGYAEFPLGVFLLTTPPRKADNVGNIIRDIEAYDLLQILVDDKVEQRYTVTAGTNYIAAVSTLLSGAGLTLVNLTPTDKTLPADRDWDPETPKLHIINDLLNAVNYKSLVIDENGVPVAEPYISPADRASEYTYKDDDKSVILPGVQEHLDLFGVANKFTAMVSQPDRPYLVSTYTNTNPDSPLSTVNRGRTILAPIRNLEAADQATLDALVQKMAFQESQVYQHVEFTTGIIPVHSDADVITLEYSKLGISAKYGETSWGFDLKSGAQMVHRARRIIVI